MTKEEILKHIGDKIDTGNYFILSYTKDKPFEAISNNIDLGTVASMLNAAHFQFQYEIFSNLKKEVKQ
jgi:hypothetical protein